jgi:hypothetical protein
MGLAGPRRPQADLSCLTSHLAATYLSDPRFLAAAPPTFWPLKVQPTLSQFLALSLAPSAIPFLDDDPTLASEAAKRRKIFDKLEKHMTLLLGAALKIEGGEEVVRIGQEDLRLLEEDTQRRAGKMKVIDDAEEGFEIDVIGVRGVAEKGRVRSRSHEVSPYHKPYRNQAAKLQAELTMTSFRDSQEFLVRTTRPGVADLFVWRRYGDFKRLSEEVSTLMSAKPRGG